MRPSEWIERHPSLRWYVPAVVTATFLAQLWEVLTR